jgi:hypothetical protein
MRARALRYGFGAAVATVALSWMGLVSSPLDAQRRRETAMRTTDGKPNLNGVWQALNTANWDIQDHSAQAGPPQFGALFSMPAGAGVVVGNDLPYKAAALARKQENFAKRFTQDPEAKCYMPGIPRATYMPFPFQIVQGTNKIMMVYEFAGANRTIHLDTVPSPPFNSWMGHSVGRWDGDTLVVDVTSQVDQTWFDRSGNFHSEQLHVVERFSLTGRDHLQYEVTVEDPEVFTRPWTMAMPLYRRLEPNAVRLEFKCVEFSEELLYGHLRKKP